MIKSVRHLSFYTQLFKWHLLGLLKSVSNISIDRFAQKTRKDGTAVVAHSIPKATLGRIPLYLQYLKDLDESSQTVSAPKIARALSLGEVQVRKDLASISGRGKPRIGYERIRLMQDLERHLRGEALTNAVLIGAGKLGRALLDYDGFEEFGIRILAGFDCNAGIMQMGKEKPILSIDRLATFCTQHDVRIGIITVGQGSAQQVCDQLVASGVRAIWNFAPCALNVPEHVLFKQENLALSLAHLNSRLKTKNNINSED